MSASLIDIAPSTKAETVSICDRYTGLGRQQRAALVAIARRRLQRRTGGWGRGLMGRPAITAALARGLIGLRLVTITRDARPPALQLTYSGRLAAGIAEQRKRTAQ